MLKMQKPNEALIFMHHTKLFSPQLYIQLKSVAFLLLPAFLQCKNDPR